MRGNSFSRVLPLLVPGPRITSGAATVVSIACLTLIVPIVWLVPAPASVMLAYVLFVVGTGYLLLSLSGTGNASYWVLVMLEVAMRCALSARRVLYGWCSGCGALARTDSDDRPEALAWLERSGWDTRARWCPACVERARTQREQDAEEAAVTEWRTQTYR